MSPKSIDFNKIYTCRLLHSNDFSLRLYPSEYFGRQVVPLINVDSWNVDIFFLLHMPQHDFLQVCLNGGP